MIRRLSIQVLRTAAAQITEAAEWWLVNRPKAPGAFLEEIERAFELISTQPKIGARAKNVKLLGVRRIHLSRIRYHLYYRVTKASQSVEVLALWHTSRGSGPELQMEQPTREGE